jgi:uncharacterized protein YkwD
MNRTDNRVRTGLFLLAAIAGLGIACGGGGGSDSPTTPLGTTVAEVEFESFQLANSARRDSNIRPALDLDERVTRLAREHSEAMRDGGFFGHRGPNGGIASRLRAAGVSFSGAGENLAKLSSVPNPAGQAHQRFMGSAEHRAVMLDAGFRLAGVGVARSGDTYWLTQVYIRP